MAWSGDACKGGWQQAVPWVALKAKVAEVRLDSEGGPAVMYATGRMQADEVTLFQPGLNLLCRSDKCRPDKCRSDKC